MGVTLGCAAAIRSSLALVHPSERLRSVARASGAPPAAVARESIGALMSFHDDPRGLLNACRRLVDRHPRSGPMMWLASRVVTATDPRIEARLAAAELDGDTTPETLATAFGEGVTVCVLGWPEVVGRALIRRGDVQVLAIDAHGEAAGFVRRLQQADSDAIDIPLESLAVAVAASSVVVLEASAIGSDSFIAMSGSFAAAAVAHALEVPVWLVGGVGRVLPKNVFASLAQRLHETHDSWDDEDELVPLRLVDHIAMPAGLVTPGDALRRCDCPVAQGLLR